MSMNNEAAIKWALELAKTLCGNPDTKILINKDGAENLADFIETLENRFKKQSRQDT